MTLAVAAQAQTKDDEIELTRSVIQAERKAIISVNMEFTDEESEAFWPVYNEYWTKMEKVNDRWLKMIKDYAKNYEALSGEKATELLNEYLDIESDALKLRKSYVKKFGKVGEVIEDAIRAYADDVRTRAFPTPEHTYAMQDGAPTKERRSPERIGASAGRATKKSKTPSSKA